MIALIVSILSALFTVLMFFYMKWYIKKRTATSQMLAEYRDEVNKLIADINFYTDRDSQVIEERINKLKRILESTDMKIADYIRELDRGKSTEGLYTSLGRGIRSALSTPVPISSSQDGNRESPVQRPSASVEVQGGNYRPSSMVEAKNEKAPVSRSKKPP